MKDAHFREFTSPPAVVLPTAGKKALSSILSLPSMKIDKKVLSSIFPTPKNSRFRWLPALPAPGAGPGDNAHK